MKRQTWLFQVAFASVLLVMAFAFSNTAFAQGDKPAPKDKVLVNDAAAKRLLMKGVLSADAARAIVDACVAWNKSIPNSLPAVIFVLSPTGQIIDSHTMDGALPIAYETGLMKAKTVLYARTPSMAVANRFNETNLSMPQRVIGLGKDYGLEYFWVSGGLPIMVDGEMVGAAGVGGGTQDEMCAYQAIVKVIGPQPPLIPSNPPPGAAPRPAAGGGGAAPATAAPAR
jgi:uncharacterized protein GlcG (DUF336 family)